MSGRYRHSVMEPMEFFGEEDFTAANILQEHGFIWLDENRPPISREASAAGDIFSLKAAINDEPELLINQFNWGFGLMRNKVIVAAAQISESLHDDGSYAMFLERIYVVPSLRRKRDSEDKKISQRMADAMLEIYFERLKNVPLELRGRCEIAGEARSLGGEAILAYLAREAELGQPDPHFERDDHEDELAAYADCW